MKHKLDRYSQVVDNFDELLRCARAFLVWRDEQHFNNTSTQDGDRKQENTPPKQKHSVIDIIKGMFHVVYSLKLLSF